ncbi:autotransporter outer membrane beta-barrel domain-containing protein [Shewanella youngdeokensis]|uniref:Autotransporter outer membrane beta-barrel domain-containing protein n=1 Tax=Shewanella youngdeokensis TaxID=2999068 RepID=A0ABZ0K189_9GAMM|nr:autotransporter outer membrane beta-barrel domain-containing protein [Shewanella sp. DAU334]
MYKQSVFITSIVLSTVAFTASAQEKPTNNRSPLSVSVSRVATASADVGGQGSELQRNQWMLDLKTGMPLNKQWFIGAKLGYDNLDYDWSSNRISGQSTWDKIERYRVSVSLSYRPNEQWMFMLAPKLQYAATDNASLGDSQSYGAVLSAMYRFGSGNMLGFGVGYLNDIDEVRTVPFLAVNWQITEQLKLGNPFSAGFSGPAGLELSYTMASDWDIGVGTSKRTSRFLIADVDKTAEIDEWVSFARVGWRVSDAVSVNGFVGIFYAGELELNPQNIKQDIENQGALALDFTYKF